MGNNSEWLPKEFKGCFGVFGLRLRCGRMAGKQTGDICVAAPTGAINELRYAGRNLLDALLANTPYASTQCIDIARRHCSLRVMMRAMRRSCFWANKIIDFSAEYPHAHVVESVPSYPSMRADVHEMRAATQEARIGHGKPGGGREHTT